MFGSRRRKAKKARTPAAGRVEKGRKDARRVKRTYNVARALFRVGLRIWERHGTEFLYRR